VFEVGISDQGVEGAVVVKRLRVLLGAEAVVERFRLPPS